MFSVRLGIVFLLTLAALTLTDTKESLTSSRCIIWVLSVRTPCVLFWIPQHAFHSSQHWEPSHFRHQGVFDFLTVYNLSVDCENTMCSILNTTMCFPFLSILGALTLTDTSSLTSSRCIICLWKHHVFCSEHCNVLSTLVHDGSPHTDKHRGAHWGVQTSSLPLTNTKEYQTSSLTLTNTEVYHYQTSSTTLTNTEESLTSSHSRCFLIHIGGPHTYRH